MSLLKMPNSRKVIIFMGSRRLGRVCDKVTKIVQDKLEAKGIKVKLFDPLEMPFEVLHEPLHFMADPSKAPTWLQDANKEILEADGFLIVSPEYNATIPPALSNMLDHFSPASYRHRPAGIVTYSAGSFGGFRVSSVLRPFLSELGMVTVPSYATLPKVFEIFNAEGMVTSERASAAVEKVVEDLDWYSEAIIRHKKEKSAPGAPQF